MPFLTCFKNKFNCETILKPKRDEIAKMNSEFLTLSKQRDTLKSTLGGREFTLTNRQANLKKYQDYSKMYNDLVPLEVCGKLTSVEEIKRIIKSSWGRECHGYFTNYNDTTSIEAHFITTSEGNIYRPPLEVFRKLATRSMVSEWRYSASEGNDETHNPNGAYACNDYATSFYSEMKVAPLGYHKMVIGILGVTGHRINCFIPAEEDKVYYYEPQNDSIWFPNFANANEKKPFHILF
jgi:hypothetical protein